MPVAIKYCPCCKQTKEVTDFGKNKTSRDGLYTYCHTCDQKKQKEGYHRRKAV